MALVIALTGSLGRWQWGRADEKRALQALNDRAARAEPISVGGERLEPSSLTGQAVRVRGRFVPAGAIYIDNRTHQGVAGFHVLMPLRIAGSQWHVLVLRGWVARDVHERGRLPALRTPEGEVEIGGIAEPTLERTLELKAAPVPVAGERLWQNFDHERYRSWSGLQLQPFIIRQSAASRIDDGLVREWRIAGVDVDKHVGYALQWFTMCAASVAVVLYLLFLVRRDVAQARSDEA